MGIISAVRAAGKKDSEIIDDLLRLRERKVTWLPKKMGCLLFLGEHQMKLLIFSTQEVKYI